eukprot:tig00001302_g8097.t1
MADDVRIVTLNSFLIPPMLCTHRHRYCQRQSERARAIGSFISETADVFTLQEVFGWELQGLEETLSKTHAISHYYRSRGRLLTGWLGLVPGAGPLQRALACCFDFCESVLLRGSGGLYHGWREGRVRPVASSWHRFRAVQTDERIVGKGATFTLMDMRGAGASWARAPHLVVANTHLNSSRAAVREAQMEELKAALSAFVGRHVPRGPPLAVLLLGDMNIAAGSPEYHAMLARLDAEDLAGHGGEEPYTFEVGANPMVAPENRSGKRIDYALGLRSLPEAGGARRPLVRLERAGYEVLKGQVLSDHWPVLVVLRPPRA